MENAIILIIIINIVFAGSAADATTADVHAEWHAHHRTGRSEQLPRTTVAVGVSSTLQGAPQVASSLTRQTALPAVQSGAVGRRDPTGLSVSPPMSRTHGHVQTTVSCCVDSHRLQTGARCDQKYVRPTSVYVYILNWATVM